MPTFNSEFDRGTYPSDDYEVIEVSIEYGISPVVPERAYLSNGDVGYPAEGGELEYLIVFDQDGNDITDQVPAAAMERFKEQAYQDDLDNNDNWD